MSSIMTIFGSAVMELPPAPPQASPLHQDNMLGAKNDAEALQFYLQKAGARSKETLRRYDREITRFTAYLYLELKVSYQNVRLKHLQNYLTFIQTLPYHWTTQGILPGQPERVLFKSSIKPGKSTDQVIDVLSSFFSFLEKNRYITGNPTAALIRSGEKLARGNTVVRYFHDSDWEFIKKCIDHLPSNTIGQKMEAARTRYIIALGYGLALRESELTHHNCTDIHPDNDNGFYLSVLGKGKKRRHIPLNNQLRGTIMDLKQLYGIDSLYGDTFPLAPRHRMLNNTLCALSPRGLRQWWRTFMNRCAINAEPELKARLSTMPFHALRHTALTHLARKMDIEDLAIFAGHDSIQTTSQYYHAEASRLKRMSADHYL
ncbi:site-specific integrase [uncultured Endozoicomonas sp.]|uniref:tyrosine-type recombinase/integrase n=1 Tax=uncultured Endozoicomonas sp. TaxID=432652 RepID=UPI00261464EB|nr:site-specific integrase [uncultured Endozoicomonas sp.]